MIHGERYGTWLQAWFAASEVQSHLFLTMQAGPSLSAARREEIASSWAFWRGPAPGGPGTNYVGLFAIARSGMESNLVQLMRSLGDTNRVRILDGVPASCEGLLPGVPRKMKEIMGASFHPPFMTVCAELAIECLSVAGSFKNQPALDRLAVGGMSFILSSFGVDERQWAKWIRTWVVSLSRVQDDPENWLDAVLNAARLRMLHTRAIADFDDKSVEIRPEWKSGMEDVAAEFWRKAPGLPSNTPPEFLIFKVFVHPLFLMLGFNNFRECLLMTTLSTPRFRSNPVNP